MNKEILPGGTTAFARAEIEAIMVAYARIRLGKSWEKEISRFLDENRLAFTVMLNTWYYMIVDQVGLNAAEQWKVAIKTMGISEVIASGDKAANAVLHGEIPQSNLWYFILQAVILRDKRPRVWAESGECTMETGDIRTFLQISRYAKRFTPQQRVPDYQSIIPFTEYQDYLRLESTNHGIFSAFEYHTQGIRAIIADLLDWDSLCDDLEAAWEDPLDLEFTPKATNDISSKDLPKGVSSKTSIFAKVHKVFRVLETETGQVLCLRQPYLEAHLKDARPNPICEYRIKTAMESGAASTLNLVPKNYKTYRTIAPEPTFWAAKALRYFRIMEKYLPSNIHLHDQRFNRALLGRASLGYPLMTVDNSMASDGVTWEFCLKVFPSRFMEIVDKVLTHLIDMSKYGRGTVKLVALATMGCPITFIMESISFLGADLYANQLSNLLMTTEVWDDELGDYISVPQVYGDDQVTWSASLPALTEICEVLGWKLNTEKTFSTGNYREACGLEVYRGEDVTPVYWPRRPFGRPSYSTYKESWETDMGALVTLQKELFYVSPGASNLLTSVIMALKPDMTSSKPGEDCSDIWAVVPRVRTKLSPYARIERQLRVYAYFDQIPDKIVPHVINCTRINLDGDIESWLMLTTNIGDIRDRGKNRWVTDDEVTRITVKTPLAGNELSLLAALDMERNIDHIRECCKLDNLPACDTAKLRAYLAIERYTCDEEFIVVPCKGKNKWILGKLTGRVRAYDLPGHEESYLDVHDSCHVEYKDSHLKDPTVELWLYHEFLHEGPCFEHGADSLIGVIERRAGITISRRFVGENLHPSLYSSPNVRW